METNLPEYVATLLTKNMRRIIIFLFTMLIGMFVGMNAAHAQTRTATPSSTRVSASPTATPQPASKNPVPIYVGTVTESSSNAVSITPAGGQGTMSFQVTPNTRFEAPGVLTKTKPTIKNIATKDLVAIVSSDKANAILVVLLPTNALDNSKSKVFNGIVSSREATSSGTVLSLKNTKQDSFAKALVSSATQVMARGMDKAVIDDIKASDHVIVLGPIGAQDIIQARRVYLIPGKARGILERLNATTRGASTTASRSASPAATPKR